MSKLNPDQTVIDFLFKEPIHTEDIPRKTVVVTIPGSDLTYSTNKCPDMESHDELKASRVFLEEALKEIYDLDTREIVYDDTSAKITTEDATGISFLCLLEEASISIHLMIHDTHVQELVELHQHEIKTCHEALKKGGLARDDVIRMLKGVAENQFALTCLEKQGVNVGSL